MEALKFYSFRSLISFVTLFKISKTPLLLKKKLKGFIHRILMPRGSQYVSDPELEVGWEKHILQAGGKSICLMSKSPVGAARGIVILSHPYLSQAKQFFLKNGHADLYLALGFRVIVYDFNGFGESPFVNFAYAEDLRLVGQYVWASYPGQKIIGHGISFGASHTINYSTYQDHVFSQIIVENCLDSNLSYYKKRNIRLHYLMLGIMKIFPGVNKDHSYEESVSRVIKISDMLLIYNEDDDLTTIAMGKKIMQNSASKSRLEIFKGQHLNALRDNRERYKQILNSFLLPA